MELMQETDDISCREELEEEEEEITREEESRSKNQHHHHHHHHYNSPPFSLSSSPSTTNHHHHHAINNIPHHQQQIPWFNMNIHDHHQNSPESHNSSSGLGLKQLDFMELSLGNNKDDASTSGVGVDPNAITSSSSANQQQVVEEAIEKEHMFDKVVTPSDVGKLNRLVIPKQHAEKYFPLDSTTNEKGLLLNFEDRNGKLWRFRYSYWNSSQSYVMTKGWSRFVKEKKLDAGDIVSFQRGVGELYRHRLYIDWRRRSNHHQYHDPSTTLFTPFFLPNPNQPPHYSMIRWGATSAATPATTARLYSTSPHTPRHYNYHMYHPFNQQQNHGGIGASGSGGNHSQYNYNEQLSSSSSSAAAGYYMRSAATSMPIFSDVQRQQQEGRGVGGGANISLSPMIIDSVPVAHHHNHYHQQQQQQQYGGNKSGSTSNTAAKRLRLFGVNMECGSSTNEEDDKANSIPSSSSLQPHQHEDNLSVSQSTTRFGDQREEAASMLFDLDPSLQYRQ